MASTVFVIILHGSALLFKFRQHVATRCNGWVRGHARPEPHLDWQFCLLAQVVWQQETAAGGFLAVVDGSHGGAEYRLLTMDHSVLGGVYRKPQEFAGQSIYDIFHLQEAVRYVLCTAELHGRALIACCHWMSRGTKDTVGHKQHVDVLRLMPMMRSHHDLLRHRLVRPGTRALAIGLGIGTAISGLQEHGIIFDVIELHSEVSLPRTGIAAAVYGLLCVCNTTKISTAMMLQQRAFGGCETHGEALKACLLRTA